MGDDETSLTMGRFDINVGRFIEEIQKRRPIWDPTCEQYISREAKAVCWAELVDLFGDFGDCDDNETVIAARKKEAEFILQKKWKNIRTCFTRDLRLQKKRLKKRSADTKNRHHPYSYKYFTKLKFLCGVTRPRPRIKRYSSRNEDTDSESSENTSNGDKRDSTSNTDQIEVELEQMDGQFSNEGVLSNFKAIQQKSLKKPKLQLKVEPEPEQETNFIDMDSMGRQILEEHDDEDKLFLLSLLSTMRLVPQEKKMTTRIKIMTVLNEATQADLRYGEASSNTYQQ